MAADTSSIPVNGDYSATNGQAYEANYDAHAANQSMSSQNEYANTNTSSASGNASDISKEEVGWYFVEQYYTTLSKSPEKLYLFYTKQSQFVSGVEAEKVSVCVGQKAISERIRELDIQDCKVRVTNVDSQGSRGNIVIQVIGEISNKSQPQRKFTQTFVLAEQANGYFVLNDIFRYVAEDDDYEQETEGVQQPSRTEEAAGGYQEPTPTAKTAAPEGLTNSDDTVAQQHDAAIVDRSLEQAAGEEPAVVAEPTITVNGDDVADQGEVAVAEDTPAAAVTSSEEPISTAEVTETAEPVQEVVSEKPQDPEPTPRAISPPKQTQPEAPPKSAAPKTWANLVAGNRIPPAMPTAPASTPAPAAAKAAPARNVQATLAPTGPAAYTAPAQESGAATPTSSGSEWQMAGHEHKRQQSRPQNQQPAQNQQTSDIPRGFIKVVDENVNKDDLYKALSANGEITYFDTNDQKRTAYVNFASTADYNNVIAGNPYEVNGHKIIVQRRTYGPGQDPNALYKGNRGGMRGGFPRGGGGAGGARGGGRGAFRGGPRGGTPAA